MRTSFLIVLIIVSASTCYSCKNVAASSKINDTEHAIENDVTMGYDSEKVTQGSWLELFLGMGRVEGGKDKDGYAEYYYECQVPELEGVEDVLSQELEATWYNNDDNFPCSYRCTMGLYIDKDYPSQAIFDQIEEGVDSLIINGFDYYKDLENVINALKKRVNYSPQKSQDILDRAKSAFGQFSRCKQATKPDTAYCPYPEVRVCIVAHKIYDQGEWASYIIEFSYDYGGTCGCPSWADYITVNKKTGHRLTTDDVVKKYGMAQVSKSLRKAFVKAKQERNFDLEVYNLSGQDLIDFADGCAIVNEGVMFYYRPYSVGCGAEGEFNLVLDYPWP